MVFMGLRPRLIIISFVVLCVGYFYMFADIKLSEYVPSTMSYCTARNESKVAEIKNIWPYFEKFGLDKWNIWPWRRKIKLKIDFEAQEDMLFLILGAKIFLHRLLFTLKVRNLHKNGQVLFVSATFKSIFCKKVMS